MKNKTENFKIKHKMPKYKCHTSGKHEHLSKYKKKKRKKRLKNES